jgi:hypothetical protein
VPDANRRRSIDQLRRELPAIREPERDDIGGDAPQGHQLDDGIVMGRVVVDALRGGAFVASNRLDDLLTAVDADRRTLTSTTERA